MGLFKNKTGKKTVTVQTARQSAHPFSRLSTYAPLSISQMQLYDSIRESLPIVDAAITKIIRLIGNFDIECDDKAAQRQINKFFEAVPAGASVYGIDSFIRQYVDSLLMYGAAVGEVVVGNNSGSVLGLLNGDVKDIEFKIDADPFNPKILVRGETGTAREVEHPERIVFSTINQTSKSPFGRSMLEGLPFVSDILLKIYSCIGANWERAGNIRYAVTYKPNDSLENAFAQDRAGEIASEWSRAMSDKEGVRDFVSIGDVEIKAIGSDGPILDSHIPVQQMLEQIVSKTGLPPFLLGLSWSTTEQMSKQQSDILTSELEYYRRVLNPVILRIGSEYLRREGYCCNLRVNWENISLQDEVQLANARLINAKAAKIERELGEY